MSDNSLRGMRLGGQSLETEENVEPAARRQVQYETEDGENVTVTFALDADIPDVWYTKAGKEAYRLGGNRPAAEEEKPLRTHWDMLAERRPEPELTRILEDKLAELRRRRGVHFNTESRGK